MPKRFAIPIAILVPIAFLAIIWSTFRSGGAPLMNIAKSLSAVPAPKLTNGSFEIPSIADFQPFTSEDQLDGWSVGGTGTAYLINNAGGQGLAHDGTQFLEIHSDRIYQLVTDLVEGQSYRITYNVTACVSDIYLEPGTITGVIGSSINIFNYAPRGDPKYGETVPWTARTLDFTAESSEMELAFICTGGTTALGAMDDVSIGVLKE